MTQEPISRKDFLRDSCRGLCALAVATTAASWLAGCAVAKSSVYTASITDKKVAVPLSLFSEQRTQVVEVPGWKYNLLVVKEKDDTFKALLMKCTHQGFKLTADKGGLHCNLHGSSFDLEGRVTNGPAAQPLATFPVLQQKDQLLIG